MRRIGVGLSLIALLGIANVSLAGEKKSVQQSKHFEKAGQETMKMDYLLFLPKGYDQSEKRYPLLIFLHGSGESGNNLELVKKHGPPKIVETRKDFPFIVVSPQSARGGWKVATLDALLDEVLKKYRVDPDRVYLTGLSMGGFGTWAWAAAHPERFAAIVPICGGGSPDKANRLKDLPIWVFHGAKDRAVPLAASERMVEALKKHGSAVRFTVYPEAGHDSWTATYNNPELYEWLLQQRREAAQK